jgi:dienelactone hydrolase
MAEGDRELVAFADWSTSYLSDGFTLPAFFVAPPGEGPFPAVVFHHGSGGLLDATRAGAEALLDMGYAVMLAVRRGHNGAPGVFWETRITAPWGSAEMGPQLVDALEDECNDALAALAWVKEQPVVDGDRVAMVGSSYGGVMVMLAARRHAPFRAGISFAGPSITWPDAPALQELLLDAMRTIDVPLFLIQAADDVHLTPTYALGGELARSGKVHEVRIYGTIGESPGDGHGVFNKAVELWRPDVERFLSRWVSTVGCLATTDRPIDRPIDRPASIGGAHG